MKRLSWSKLFTLGALVSLGIVTHAVATAQGPARIPISVSQTSRIPATYPNSNPLAPQTGGVGSQRAQFEGPNATDYFTFQNNFNLAANPQIAVGPEDILLVVNSQIFRTPNGNAAGVTPTTLYPNYTATGGQANAFQRAFLDNWVGEAALNQLCPTGAQSGIGGVADSANTRSSVTCQLENATVTYDQMHGRFLVLFTAVDTGLTFDNQSQGYRLTRPRKASWVLLVSQFAVLADQACLQGTSPGTCPVAGGNSQPNPAGTFTFITPTPPLGTNTGGVNVSLWTIFYGNSLNAIGTDGFGNTVAAASGAWVGNVGAGNINAIPGIAAAAPNFSCDPGAVYALGALPTTPQVCYLPTSARIGVDNDTVTIASGVINGNIPSGESSATLNTGNFQYPDYAGTRVRVIKKSALYTGGALSAGNQFGSTFANRSTGSYYDLYTSPDTIGTPTTSGAGVPPIVYTTVAGTSACVAGVQGVVAPGALTVCTPIFYEPAHLRGRAMASFSNSPAAPAGIPGNSQTYLIGTIYNTASVYDNNVYIQGIRELYQNPLAPAVTFGALPFYPVLQSGNTASGTNGIGIPSAVAVDFFTGPGSVSQQNYRTGATAPSLYVGDNRPHTLIFREGQLYDARVVGAQSPVGIFPGGALSTTVAYDIIQKAGAGAVPQTVFQTSWQNATAYAPMFDIPANVKTYGVVTPLTLLQWLEKGADMATTTYPPLAGLPDPGPYAGDLAANAGAGDPRTRETFGATGLNPITLPAQANCFNAHLTPGSSIPGGGANNNMSWASLFDVRCGQDATDSNPQVRDPQSGLVGGRYSYTVRGGAGIDPNDGSIWAFGAYAQKRNASIAALAHWGTFAANYKLSTATTDDLGNAYQLYTDIAGLGEAQNIMIAANVGLAPNTTQSTPNITPYVFQGANAILYPTLAPGVTAPGVAPATGKFGPNDEVTRAEMAYWIVKSQMDEQAITDYLAASGGNSVTFVDVPFANPAWRYVEVMARRGYTSGCAAGTARRYCPDYISTRKDLAVFMIRAKMSNVFPSVLSGCSFQFQAGTTSLTSTLFPPALTTNCATGDNFALFTTGLNYFTDNPKVTGNDEYVYLQKMRELRITNGTSLGAALDGRNGAYNRGVVSSVPPSGDPGNLLRKQVATFMVRGFFY